MYIHIYVGIGINSSNQTNLMLDSNTMILNYVQTND